MRSSSTRASAPRPAHRASAPLGSRPSLTHASAVPAEAAREAPVSMPGSPIAGPLAAATRALPRFPENEYDYSYLADFLRRDSVPKDCRAAVLGCGRGEEAVYFSERGYRVTGIDSDRNSIGLARERAWLNGRDIDFMIGEVFESVSLLPAESFGLATDRGVFRAIEGERERRRYLELIRRILLPSGVLLLSATMVDPRRRARKGKRRRKGQDDLLVQEGGEVMGEVLRAGLPIAGRRVYSPPAAPAGIPAGPGPRAADPARSELLLYCRKS